MTDILGPGSNATNVTTTRPADSRIMAAIDTWLQDCTSSTAQDGTEISAEFLNGVLANLRVLARGNGPQISGGPVVPEDNSDLMLLNAALHLIQRGKMHVATDAGGVNALVAQLSPVPPELVDGMLIVMRPAIANTGPSTLSAAGVINPVVSATGAPLGGGELNPSLFSAFRWNVTLGKWQLGDSVPEAALVHFGADTSAAANTIIANVTPAISSYKPGMLFSVPVANLNTGSSQANFNGLGLKNIVLNNSGAALAGGEMSNIGGYTALFLYDGVSLRLLNPLPKGVSRIVPFTASGTFTPVGSLVMVQEWAGGAAGRNVGGSSYTAGQGGGAGEYRYGYFQVTPGVGIAVTVGAGAAAGSNGNGGASSFGSLMTALGAIGTAGGTGGSGGYGFSGGAGSPGFSNGNVTGAIVVIGSGGVPYLAGLFGGGGQGGDGGPSGNPNGRAGQPGFVLVSEVG